MAGCMGCTSLHNVDATFAAGIVPTKFAAALVASPEMEEVSKSRTLLGRLGTPQVGVMAAGL